MKLYLASLSQHETALDALLLLRIKRRQGIPIKMDVVSIGEGRAGGKHPTSCKEQPYLS